MNSTYLITGIVAVVFTGFLVGYSIHQLSKPITTNNPALIDDKPTPRDTPIYNILDNEDGEHV